MRKVISSMNEEKSGLDRRAFLKTAAASTALLMPAIAFAQPPQAAPRRPTRSDQTGGKGQAKGTGGLSKARLGRMHHAKAKGEIFPLRGRVLIL